MPPAVSGSAEVSGPPTHTHTHTCTTAGVVRGAAKTLPGFFFRSNSSVMGGQGLVGRRKTFVELHRIQIMTSSFELLLCGREAISLVINSLGSVVSCIFKLAETICLQRVEKPPTVETKDKGQKTDNQ